MSLFAERCAAVLIREIALAGSPKRRRLLCRKPCSADSSARRFGQQRQNRGVGLSGRTHPLGSDQNGVELGKRRGAADQTRAPRALATMMPTEARNMSMRTSVDQPSRVSTRRRSSSSAAGATRMTKPRCVAISVTCSNTLVFAASGESSRARVESGPSPNF